MFNTYYSLQFTAITKANEALQMLKDLEEANGETAETRQYKAEAYFIRAAAYFRLTQAFGAVPYVDRVMGKDEAMADQLSATVILQQVSARTDRSDKRPCLPAKKQSARETSDVPPKTPPVPSSPKLTSMKRITTTV